MTHYDRPIAHEGLVDRIQSRIREHSFPCIGAKASLARHRLRAIVVGDIRCRLDDRCIYDALRSFALAYATDPVPFQSLAVIFDTATCLNEAAFEVAMWSRLQALESLDASEGHAYDHRVSANVRDANFSLSFAGEAFFAVGLHPQATRAARRFEQPAIVFNPHAQFEILRIEGRYERLRKTIISRDIAVSGSANPMLARHGERSEARQYSGRAVDDNWSCPFKRVHNA